MKYCPYCGTALADADASFCMECGRPLSGGEQIEPVEKEAAVPKKKGRGSRRKKKNTASTAAASPRKQPDAAAIPPVEDGYDGYYDDILPADEGDHREGVSRELVKKIALLLAGVLLVVTASIAVMYLL